MSNQVMYAAFGTYHVIRDGNMVFTWLPLCKIWSHSNFMTNFSIAESIKVYGVLVGVNVTMKEGQ